MNPFKKFNNWFDLASKKYEFDPTAFALSTCDGKKPHVRMVLLKKILKDGFVFFTNLNSNKGKQFKKNNNLSMCFYWESLKKQIRISGKGIIINDEESNKYFSSRPRPSQLGAWASKQSSVIESRKILMERYKKFDLKYRGKDVSRPPYWVGIKIQPEEFEFWEGDQFRLHKREIYKLKKKSWEVKTLSP
tara:strand:+ start:411 stop:980 length:570 start_codon:yes stop_codon:yes gene_type:complete